MYLFLRKLLRITLHVIMTLPSLHGGSLKIMLTVPLSVFFSIDEEVCRQFL